MKYPVDVEEWVKEMRRVNPNATAADEARQREHIVPLINLAYDDGLHDLDGFPVAEGELFMFLEGLYGDLEPSVKGYISMWMQLCNLAYEAGLKQRGRGEVYAG